MTIDFKVRGSAPPPRAIDTSAAEQSRAHRLWDGRAGREANEAEVIETILAVEAPNLTAEQRGAQRSAAKAALALAYLEPGARPSRARHLPVG